MPRTPFSRGGKNSPSQLSCMVGHQLDLKSFLRFTNGDTEQLNVFGRNLNTVIRIWNLSQLRLIADNDCRSRAKIGSVKDG